MGSAIHSQHLCHVSRSSSKVCLIAGMDGPTRKVRINITSRPPHMRQEPITNTVDLSHVYPLKLELADITLSIMTKNVVGLGTQLIVV